MTPLQIGDYAGTFVFAVTGALAAAEKRLDIGGFILLGFVTGVGGGTLRDMLLARGGVFWATDPAYILICAAASIATFFAAERFSSRRRLLIWADALGLALFSAIGAGIAWGMGSEPIVAVLMGALTATGGGVIRDIIRNELPIVLHKEIYVTAALGGAAAFVGLAAWGAPKPAPMLGAIVVAFSLRALGIALDWHLPSFKPRG